MSEHNQHPVDAVFTGCEISLNEAQATGGGIGVIGGTLTLTDSRLYNNQALGGSQIYGGGLYMRGNGYSGATMATIVRTIFVDNSASDGCDLYLRDDVNSASSLSELTFADHGSRAVCTAGNSIVSLAPISFHCPLGMWSPFPASFPIQNFTGCPYLCPAGYYGASDLLTSAQCSGACPAGTYCPAGAAEYENCAAGFYLPEGVTGVHEKSCIPCSPGTFSTVTGLVSNVGCEPCPPGTLSESLNSTQCSACPSGGYCSTSNAASLRQTFTPCPPGTHNPSMGSSSDVDCLACPPGKFNPIPGSTSSAVCMGASASLGPVPPCLRFVLTKISTYRDPSPQIARQGHTARAQARRAAISAFRVHIKSSRAARRAILAHAATSAPRAPLCRCRARAVGVQTRLSPS